MSLPPRTRAEARAAHAAADPGSSSSGWRSVLDALTRSLRGLSPWRTRIVVAVLILLGLVLLSVLVDVRTDLVRVVPTFLALAALSWYALDHLPEVRRSHWPLTDGEALVRTRGNDFRVTSLANRLEAAAANGDGRVDLVQDLHVMLSRIIREKLATKHGITIEDEPAWAQGVMPPELWEFLVTLPPPDLYLPTRLDPLLRRIEQW